MNNASEILYTYSKVDSVLSFDEEYEFTENARFRAQRVRLRLYVPYEKPFSMTREFASFIENRISGGYFDGEKDLFKGSLWQFTREGELVCLNRFPVENNYDNHSDSSDDETDFAPNDFVQKFPLKEFNKVEFLAFTVVESNCPNKSPVKLLKIGVISVSFKLPDK